ncbi:MAG: MarR family transcriptional regulator [Firmicutes bacterium]|nr:MarR family transcriptional regulator [Bacillota bacterium]
MEKSEARRLLMNALGIQSGFWGIGRITGELYAILYTAQEPLTLAEIAAELGVTKGNVSVAIRRLEELGMVRRQYQPGDRRVFFAPNIDFWDIGRHFLQRRYQPAFATSFQLVDDSIRQAEASGDTFVQNRIETLKKFYDLLDQLTAILLTANPMTLASLGQEMLQMASSKTEAPTEMEV